jgi:hypothetical protein
MSSQEQHGLVNGGRPPRSGGPVIPPCPTCERPMTVKQVSSVLFASGLDDVVYGCEDCGTEAHRTVKRI